MIAVDFEERIDAYDAALQRCDCVVDLHEYLPPTEAPEYFSTLVELLRITLEHEWQPGNVGVERYRAKFPDLFANPRWLEPLVFEEYRLRCSDGESVSRQELAERYEVDVTAWPELAQAKCLADASCGNDDWLEFSRSEPISAIRALVGKKTLPEVGAAFGTFQLIALLGEGAFGRVFLARQQSLADRLVALKITPGKATEAQKLARLQHGNIMPVYSVHCRGKLSGICMPFLGSATLAEVIARQKTDGQFVSSSESLVRTLEERRAEFATIAEGNLPKEAESPAARRNSALPTRSLSLARIMQSVADGLAQAHERGILHRDIKPANILIADDGQPLLLDFNLAAEQSGHMARIGGTLPYMSPEQLAQFAGKTTALDGRSDIYSLGVVLFECLTGRQPFPLRRGPLEAIVQQMLADRQMTPPDVRTLSKSIEPGLAAIVDRCLQPNVDQRYQRAQELCDDLRLHLDNYPLRHTRNPSFAELSLKWCRRHPRLTSISTVLTLVCCLALAAGTIWYAREQKLADKFAAETFRQVDDELLKAKSLLLIGGKGSDLEAEGIRTAAAGLKQYDVLSQPDWFAATGVRRLSADEQVRLRCDVGEILLLLARRTKGKSSADGMPSPTTLESLAQQCRARHSNNETETLLALADGSTGKSWSDAEKNLRTITLSRPRDAFAWLALAQLYRMQGKLAEAEAAASAAVALRADLDLAWLMRGIIYQGQRRWLDAEEDFSQAIGLRGDHPTAYFNRGICRQELKQHQAAIADFTAAIEWKFTETRVYFSRAHSLRESGDTAAAAADLKQGQSLEPRDSLSYVARALSYLPEKAVAAEAELKSALQLEPASRIVLMNLAHVQSEHLQKTEQALEVLAQIEQLYPNDTDAIGSRAVLFARLQQGEPAVAELKKLLKVDIRPPLAIYQSACVYALLSKDQPALRGQALQLLATSLATQPSLVNTARGDADLANLRAEPLFAQLVPPPRKTNEPE